MRSIRCTGRDRSSTHKYGADFSRWEIPAHQVRLAVMSGASAGGMTAAIAAAALCEEFTPVRHPLPAVASNRLYKAWVEDIDISSLLGSEDLNDQSKRVVSLLDSTPIDKIASSAVQVTKPLEAKRPYVADVLKLVLTLTNLGGIPYALEANEGRAETQTLYRADQANFEVRWDATTEDGLALTLSPNTQAHWAELAEAAKATGAFPIALAPRRLARTTTMYNQRKWRLSNAAPRTPAGDCQCEYVDTMQPNWNKDDGYRFTTLNVDGGVTNNDPFECARQELLQEHPAQPIGHNPRSADEADRAVISIAPFLSTPEYAIDSPPDAGFGAVLAALLDTMVNQSRMQGENIKLTKDPNVYSRWVISPSIDETTRKALASAALGAFGGFIAKEFRDHDYQLGRRNCQWFLKRHFGVPLTNIVVKDYAPRAEFLDRFGMTLEDGRPGIALIPLIGSVRDEIPELKVRIPQERLIQVADLASKRLKLVGSRVLLAENGSWLRQLGFEAGWLASETSIKVAILRRLGSALARQDLIQ